jgi:hypothetical protein
MHVLHRLLARPKQQPTVLNHDRDDLAAMLTNFVHTCLLDYEDAYILTSPVLCMSAFASPTLCCYKRQPAIIHRLAYKRGSKGGFIRTYMQAGLQVPYCCRPATYEYAPHAWTEQWCHTIIVRSMH